MNKESIVMLKLLGQEFIIGQKVSEDDKTITLKDARNFQIQMQRTGVSVAFPHIFPFSDKRDNDISIQKCQIITYDTFENLDVEIVNAYISQMTGIDVVSSSKPKLVVPDFK